MTLTLVAPSPEAAIALVRRLYPDRCLVGEPVAVSPAQPADARAVLRADQGAEAAPVTFQRSPQELETCTPPTPRPSNTCIPASMPWSVSEPGRPSRLEKASAPGSYDLLDEIGVGPSAAVSARPAS
ncbi:MAG: hypothetical protein MZV65_43005 [Chromatiales bacterium]|nr:hypothetical protein [Chromatiales bacterium]